MFCDKCGKSLNQVNNFQSDFMSYSFVPDKVKFFESIMGQKKMREFPRDETNSQRRLRSSDDNFGDSTLKNNTNNAKGTPTTKHDGIIQSLHRPNDMKKLTDKAIESIKSNMRAIRLIDKILK